MSAPATSDYAPGVILDGINGLANKECEIMAVFFVLDKATLRLVERAGATGFTPRPDDVYGGCPYHGTRPCLEADDGVSLPCEGVRGFLFEDGKTFVMCGATTRAS
jgi:hypothetical protein